MTCKKSYLKATVTSNKETIEYNGSTGNTFNSRWYNHNQSFNTVKENSTELAKYIWFKKRNNNIKYNIIHQIGEVRRINKICSTCSIEKLEIARASKKTI